MKTTVIFNLLLIMLVVSTSCQKDMEINETNALGTDPVNFYKNKLMFDETIRLRSEGHSSPFSIDYIERKGDILKIEVSYAKGCEGTFHVIWDGNIMESYPMQANLVMKFDATGCPELLINGETIRTIISIDLVSFIGDKNLVKETIFEVSNASSMQDVTCKGNCGETTTNE